MNSLSWFLYAADAFSNLRGVLFGIGGAALAVGGGSWLAWSVCKGGHADRADDTGSYSEGRRKQIAEWIEVWNPLRRFLPLGVIGLLLACLLPSSSTLYAIAASQIGEQVVKSEAVQGIASDATKALQQWIKKQIEPTAK